MIHPIPDAALANHTAIVGKTGSGKSYAAKGVIERLLARGERVAIVDPTGVYWGLRLAPDGRAASAFAPVIFGGRHADLPLPADAGARLAAIIGGSATPVILDTQLMSVGERTRLFTAFAEALLRENHGPLTLVLDEAHLFAPQGGAAAGGFETTQLLHATNNLVSLGRSAGLCILLITQRPAKLHKDALTQVETLVALRVTSPQDRKAVSLWLEGAPALAQSADIIGTLASLKTGEGWVYAPEQGVLERASFPAIATFDSGRPLAAGEMPALKPIDVAALREAMTTMPDKHIATDRPTNINRRAPAKNDAGDRQQGTAEAATKREEIEAAERRGFDAGYEQGVRDSAALWALRVKGATDLLRALQSEDGDLAELHRRRSVKVGLNGIKPATEHAQSRPAPTPAANSVGLSPTAQRIVDVLEGAYPLSLTFKAAALRAGASPRSSQFRSYQREVEAAPAIEVVGDRLRARRGDPAKGKGNMILAYAAKLQPSWAAMLATLAGSSQPLAREEIADRSNVSRTSSGLAAGLKELVAMELAVRQPDGLYALNPDLRP